MILPNTLNHLTKLTTHNLSEILSATGYHGCSFKHCEFQGINQDCDFVYLVTYYDDHGLGETKGQVYIRFNHQDCSITAEF